jgi:2-amino-4-ketopentanoate thiolase alpha subunit
MTAAHDPAAQVLGAAAAVAEPREVLMSVVAPGTWVEVERIVLEVGERAPGLPADTAAVPLVLRVSGFLLEPSEVGAPARVRTLIGREHSGSLRTVNPSYTHSFGDTVAELLTIGTQAER